MKHTKLTSAALALALTAILGGSSALAFNPTNAGDLILGFQSSASTNVYEVDLGNASEFIGVTSPLTFALSVSDLSSTTVGFGSTWNTSTAVQFGLIGGAGSPTTVAGATANTLFTSWNTFATAPVAVHVQTTAQNDINNLYSQFNNGTNTTPGSATPTTPTTPLVATTHQSGNTDSFAYHEANDPNFNFGAGFGSSQLDFNSDGSNSAVDVATLNLYKVSPTASNGATAPGLLLGQFKLADSGVLTFSPTATPEPSAYALGLTAIALFFVLKRRQSIGQI